MEIKFGPVDRFEQEDGSFKHVYKQGVNGTQLTQPGYFENIKQDVDVLSSYNTIQQSEVIILVPGEPLTDRHGPELIIDFQKYCEDREIKFNLVISSDWKDEVSYLDGVKNLFYIDLQLYIYFHHRKVFNQVSNKTLNFSNRQALFLTGKPFKPTRLGMLKRIYEMNHVKKFKSSSWLPKEVTHFVKDITGFDSEQYQNFRKTMCNNSLDNIKVNHNEDFSSFHYLGLPYDHELYSQTCCSLISETWWHSPKHITEKTWRAIDNCHPFVIAGSPNTLKYLRDLGFCTFENFMTYPTYDEVERYHDSDMDTLNAWMDQIIQNCIDIINTTKQLEISDLCRKNKKRLYSLYLENAKKVKEFYPGDPHLLYQGIDANR